MEVCVLTAVVAAALLASEKYLRGAIQGHWRGNADAFSDEQYNPPDDEAIDPGSSEEYGKVKGDDLGGKIIIENPTLDADIGIDGTNELNFDLADAATPKYLQLAGWGNYSDAKEHDD
jgi:hypothetical protein